MYTIQQFLFIAWIIIGSIAPKGQVIAVRLYLIQGAHVETIQTDSDKTGHFD